MGMGYGAGMAVVIDPEQLLKIIPEEYNSLVVLMEDLEMELEALAQSIFYDDDLSSYVENLSDNDIEKIYLAYESLLNAFNNKTNLSLFLNYHNPDDGDQYDDVSGAFFELSFTETYQLSPEAQVLHNCGVEFDLKFFVNYG